MNNYRKDIDGLRGIAVILVVAFHTAPSLMPGGFIGVDVFFVISGYLITSILIRDLKAGTFSLVEFWERRARRILPALFAVVLATILISSVFFLPEDLKDLGSSSLYQALFAANFYFWLDSGYFSSAAEFKPLLHTWSLAVEEQYYLLFPAFLYSMRKFPTRFQAISLVAICTASLAICIYCSQKYPAANFFLLPTRAWELLAGGLLAWFGCGAISTKFNNSVALVGFLMILLPAAFYTRATVFPGITAVAPVLGATCLIAVGDKAQFSCRILSHWSLGYVGLISYSLYLWHWPLLVLPHYLLGLDFSPAFRIVSVIVSFAVATASWKFIETPFRRKDVAATRKRLFVFAGSAIVFLLSVSAILIRSNGWIGRFPLEFQQVVIAHSKYSAPKFECKIELSIADSAVLIGDQRKKPSFVLWGDSHALMICEFLDQEGKARGWSGYSVATSGINGGSPITVDRGTVLSQKTKTRNERVLRFIVESEIKYVLIAGRWDSKFRSASMPEPNPFKWIVDELSREGVSVAIMQQIPKQKNPNYFQRRLLLSFLYGTAIESTSLNDYLNENRVSRDSISASGAFVVDPAGTCFDSSENSIVEVDGLPAYYDDDHFNDLGVETLLRSPLNEWRSQLGE